jgi:hypothetical protein
VNDSSALVEQALSGPDAFVRLAGMALGDTRDRSASDQNDIPRTVRGDDEPYDLSARIALESPTRLIRESQTLVIRFEEVARNRREGRASRRTSDGPRNEMRAFQPNLQIVC